MSTRLFVNLSQIYLPLWLQDRWNSLLWNPMWLSCELLRIGSGRFQPFAGCHECGHHSAGPFRVGVLGVALSGTAHQSDGAQGKAVVLTLKGPRWRIWSWFRNWSQVVYLLGVLIGMGACVLVWFGSGDLFRSYGVYGVASLFGISEIISSDHNDDGSECWQWASRRVLFSSRCWWVHYANHLISLHGRSYRTTRRIRRFRLWRHEFYRQTIQRHRRCHHPVPTPLPVTILIPVDQLHSYDLFGRQPVSRSFFFRGCCDGCKPYYVIVLALVCGGAGLFCLLSLATIAPMQIGFHHNTGVISRFMMNRFPLKIC